MDHICYKQKWKVFLNWIICLHSFGLLFFTNPIISYADVGINIEDFDDKKDDQDVWDTNPFVKSTNRIKISDLTLSAVIYHPEQSAALINNKVFTNGDKIGGIEIISISKDHVMLKNLHGIFRLELRAP